MQMRMKKGAVRWLVVLAAFAIVASACSDGGDDVSTEELTPVTLQMQWFTPTLDAQ
ncbi:MAG: hypothetical protein O3B42_01455 [Actinomycetota bacterium]|nr:hypothetical protein [Actinomycetota bacterium]